MNSEGWNYADVAGRLKSIMEDVPGQNIEEKSKTLSVPSSSLYAYIAGKKRAPLDLFIKIKDVTGVNLNWLLVGEGGPSSGGGVSDDFIRLAQKFDDYIELHKIEMGSLIKYSIIVDVYNFLSNETNFSEDPDGVDVESLFRLILKKWDDANATQFEIVVKK